MKRRDLLVGMAGFTAVAVVPNINNLPVIPPNTVTGVIDPSIPPDSDPPALDPVIDREQPVVLFSAKDQNDSDSMVEGGAPGTKEKTNHLSKSIDFAHDYDDDIFVAETEMIQLQSLFLRLDKLQKTIGYGHFNLVSLDQAITYGKRYSAIGKFTEEELAFMEQLFSTDASVYGFYGKKVTETLSASFNNNNTKKIPYSGHYLFTSESLAYYEKLQQDMGDSIVLTSGVRSNIKQLYLFVAKAIQVNGNLSRASRSLAPPGYSYHGIGDFDVGKIGWGARNFSDDFATTDEYKKMQDLGYIAIRYDEGNKLGVRFEPWHIKVV